jgi:hypothetical protein
MITGLADRRVIGDGAHCGPSDCMYSINDRISDLGRVMAQSDENLSVQLIQKYRGTSPKAYWIASDDLIGKFQWVQYFGTGCDARSEARCPLYQQIPLEKAGTTPDGKMNIEVYSSIYLFEANIPIPVYTQGRIAAFFDEILFYENETSVRSVKMDQIDPVSLNETKTMIQSSLNLRFSNQTVPTTVWVPNHRQFIVMIPPTLRDAVFTKMFMLEGAGLENFKQVFRNENIKIYEVLFK